MRPHLFSAELRTRAAWRRARAQQRQRQGQSAATPSKNALGGPARTRLRQQHTHVAADGAGGRDCRPGGVVRLGGPGGAGAGGGVAAVA